MKSPSIKHMIIRVCTFVLLLFSLPEAEANRHTKQTDRIGPFLLQSSDQAWRLQIGFVGQIRYQMEVVDIDRREQQDLKDKIMLQDKIILRRVRINLKGRAITKQLEYRLQLSTAPGALELMDLYLDYRFFDRVQIRVGQYKIPFTRYRLGSFGQLTFNDWSITAPYFGAERQIGVMVFGDIDRLKHLTYKAGVFTGINARASHATGLTKMFGEEKENPSDLVNPAPAASFHPELVGHVAYNLGKINTKSDTDFEGGPLRISTALSAAWDLDPNAHRDLSFRLSPEMLLKLRGFSFFGVFYLGFYKRGDSVTAQHLGFIGGMAQLSYLATREMEFSFRYAIVHTSDKLLSDAHTRAEQLIAAEKDSKAIEVLRKQYGKAGTLIDDYELTMGLNIYLIGTSLKLQNDLSWLIQTKSDGDHHGMRFRCQLHLAF